MIISDGPKSERVLASSVQIFSDVFCSETDLYVHFVCVCAFVRARVH